MEPSETQRNRVKSWKTSSKRGEMQKKTLDRTSCVGFAEIFRVVVGLVERVRRRGRARVHRGHGPALQRRLLLARPRPLLPQHHLLVSHSKTLSTCALKNLTKKRNSK